MRRTVKQMDVFAIISLSCWVLKSFGAKLKPHSSYCIAQILGCLSKANQIVICNLMQCGRKVILKI